MSNTITHLAVAKKILETIPGFIVDNYAFYLGTLAPDTIGSKPGCTREDKKRAHLRQDIRDAQWLEPDIMKIFGDRVELFVRTHVQNDSIPSSQRSFNIGYLIHLLTDKWNHMTIRQTMLRIANDRGIQENDREFFHMMTNDLEALDEYLLRQDPGIFQLFLSLTEKPSPFHLHGYIEAEYMNGSFLWWKENYLPGIKTRKLLYITEQDIDDFIVKASQEITKDLLSLL